MAKQKGVNGFLDNEGVHYDTGYSLLGSKQCATRRGYDRVSIRYGYNVIEVAIKENGKWKSK